MARSPIVYDQIAYSALVSNVPNRATADSNSARAAAVWPVPPSERATSSEWFGPRLRDAQVPLYASQSAERVAAAVVARLTPAEVRYFGFWPEGSFPGRASRAANPDTDAQLAVWPADDEDHLCLHAQKLPHIALAMFLAGAKRLRELLEERVVAVSLPQAETTSPSLSIEPLELLGELREHHDCLR